MSSGLATAVLVVLSFVATACGAGGGTETRTGNVADAAADGAAGGVAGDATGVHTVTLTIREGPDGATLAFVPVTIDGKGPFPFAIDTGAANSVVAAELAEELELDVVEDSEHTVRGVGGQTRTELVQVADWRLGEGGRQDVTLPSANLSTVELPGQLGDAGLLGSDVLSTFGTVTVDYDNATLRLGEPDGTD